MKNRSHIKSALIATLTVTGAIFVVPILVYGVFTHFGLTEMPGDSPAWFLAGVFVSKLGTALAFITFFGLSTSERTKSWAFYGLIWFLMFAFGEVGQAMGPSYSWDNAVAGIVSESVYFPLSAFLLSKFYANEPT